MFMRFTGGDRRRVQDIVGGPTGMQARFFGEVEGALAFALIPKAIGFSFTQNLRLQVQYQDLDELARVAGDLANKLRSEGYLLNVRSVFQVDKPQLNVTIDRDRAAALGVTIQEISRTMQILFGGLDLSRVKKGRQRVRRHRSALAAIAPDAARLRQCLRSQQHRTTRPVDRGGERAGAGRARADQSLQPSSQR
jgi:multidrug efflux pump subunit AcrB